MSGTSLRSSLVVTLVMTAIIITSALPSYAAPPSAGEVLFREGRTAMQERDYERACTKFAESQKVEPAPGTALNLGECEEQRKHLLAANEAFALAAATFTSPDKQKYAQSRADAVDKRIPRLTVRMSVPTPGLSVKIGTSVVQIDTETKRDPGDLVIHAEAPGKKPKDLPTTLHEAKNLDIDIGALEPLTSTTTFGDGAKPKTTTATTTIATPPKQKPSLKTIGIIAAGVGAASLIVGGVTGVMALGRASTVEEHCDDSLACDPEGVDAASSGSTLSLISTITLIAGGALVAGGGVLYFIAPKASKDGAGLTLHVAF